MKVINEVKVYEINGSETPIVDYDTLNGTIKIISHWNYNDRFVIEVGGVKYTVIRDSFIKAINNACNH